MAAYILDSKGKAVPILPVKCKNEETELQDLLENNPLLIPGEQINPDNPCRWLPIAREMGVPDPTTGSDRWSIDMVFGDQNAIPTFIEVKRFGDTRSRREVVGQMFDYAANGHYYWDNDLLKAAAEGLAQKHGDSLEERMNALNPSDDLTVDDYFNRMVDNLREGQIRLVFFLEKAPMELKSVVDFLNKQMERTEVLLVEAEQYDIEGKRVVIPSLFGYTEEARQVKRVVTVTSGKRRKWNEGMFFTDVGSHLAETETVAIRCLYNFCDSVSDRVTWGTGKVTGSFNPKIARICNNALFSVKSSGHIELNFGWLGDTERGRVFRDDFKNLAVELFGFNPPEDWESKYPRIEVKVWSPRIEDFLVALQRIIEK